MKTNEKLDVLARVADAWGRESPEFAAVADLVEAADLALADHEMEGVELSHDTVTCLRAALAKFGGAA